MTDPAVPVQVAVAATANAWTEREAVVESGAGA